MSKKLNVAILCGGQSAEHEISLMSAKNIVDGIDKDKFNIQLIGINKSGSWHKLNSDNFLINPEDPKKVHFSTEKNQVFFSSNYYNKQIINCENYEPYPPIDVVIPVLHGPNGEDGTIQGLFKLAGIPIVGCNLISSAICMDKDIAKKLLKLEGIPVCRHLLARKNYSDNPSFKRASVELGTPLFIKPANMGSSVGVSKVSTEGEYNQALKLAFKYDNKLLIEEAVKGRELEIALLGNIDPKTSAIGEITSADFYSFDAKYTNNSEAQLSIPAQIPDNISTELSTLAKKAFIALECSGLARCDFFLTEDNKLLINELNTFPGFTNISQYPMLWKESGVQLKDLITKLIELAL